MGEITLIDDWVCIVDELNYTLAKKVPKKTQKEGEKEFYYKHYGYYGSLTNALYALCDRLTRDELRAKSPITLKDAIKTITESYDRISDQLKEVLDGR